MVRVYLSNGNNIECTLYHKFYVNNNKEFIEAKELKKGMKINNYELPLIDNCSDDYNYPYLNGLLSSFSFTRIYNLLNLKILNKNNKPFVSIEVDIYLFNKIKEYIYSYKILNNRYNCIINNNYINLSKLLAIINNKDISREDIKKNLVPYNSSIKNKLLWLEGLYDICGYINNNTFNILNENSHLLI